MASPSGNPNQPGPFELGKLFRPPNPNPNAIPSTVPSFYGAVAPPYTVAPPPSGPYSYPPATPPFHHHPFLQYPQDLISRPVLPYPLSSPNPSPNPGARLMQLLGNGPLAQLDTAVSMPPPSSTPPDFVAATVAPLILHAIPLAHPAVLPPGLARMPSSKMPRGRKLGGGDQVVYDVDSRLPGESHPPQLEVTPITKYTSDPGLVLGRQIAVNRTYIVYGLKLGNIRVLNINTALRSLIRGHTQRVTDMTFFAEDVQLLASASVDGRIFVWKIEEGPDEENKPQITEKIVTAIQIVGDGESYHPRICWHSHKQEILFVGIGSCVLKIDTNKVGRGRDFTAEEPLKCPIEKLIDGVHFVGKHDGDVTDLSISQWMTTRLASASKDGTVKIWDDRKAVPLTTLRPHEGQAVNSVAFLPSPHRPDHINLITAGPLSREAKIWAFASEEGWLLPGDSESWKCTQTLDLRSSIEPKFEESFFNQVVVLPQASLIILANAKKNAIYAVHIDYGPYPASTRMDYVADFTVAMPILSLTGTNELLPDGELAVQVYCVQTMAIQQYALELSLCLPPTTDNAGVGRDTSVSHVFEKPSSEVAIDPCLGLNATEYSADGASPKLPSSENLMESAIATSYPMISVISDLPSTHESSTLSLEFIPSAPPLIYADVSTAANVASTPIPSNLASPAATTVSKTPSKGFEQGPSLGEHDVESSVFDYSSEGRLATDATISKDTSPRNDSLEKDEPGAGTDIPTVPNSPLMFKMGGNIPTHLITPSEILSGALSSADRSPSNHDLKSDEEKVHNAVANNSSQNKEMAVKVVHENKLNQKMEEAHVAPEEDKDDFSKSSKQNLEMANEYFGQYTAKEPQFDDGCGAIHDSLERPSTTGEEISHDSTKDNSEMIKASSVSTELHVLSASNGKKEKAKQVQAFVPTSPFSSFHSTDTSNEPTSSSGPSTDIALSQISAMQDTLQQIITMQKELQKQMSTLAIPVAKEGKRIEMALGRNMEKSIKANIDALWARLQEENAKYEKTERDRMQQMTTLITNSISKDLPAILDRAIKKEISALAPVVARAVTPIIEKNISSAIADLFQKGVGDKVANQLDKSVNSKLEATVARQIQAQFQTSGKQALQDALRSSLESSVIPAFEQSCKVAFEQIDSAFQKGMSEHTASVQQQTEAAHTPLALTLRDAINSASSITQSLTTELLDGQRQLLALVAAGNPNPLSNQATNARIAGIPEMQVEAPLDPMKELTRLISERKYEEAFTMALQRSDVSIVSWLCSQVDLHGLCSMEPLPLNQGILLALLQQLACDIGSETSRKVAWMTDVASAITPSDPMIAVHVRPIFEQVYNILAHQRSVPTTTSSDGASIRLIMHVINSVLMSCK